MQNFKFEGLGDDVRVQSLGSLFRRVDGQRWGVNVGFYPKQDKSSLTMSNAPVLARRAVLNPTKDHDSRGWQQSFQIKSTQYWTTKKIKECPAIDNLSHVEANQNCFVFKIQDGKTVYLPHFELARALFFHDSYLSRTAIEPDCLAAEFDVTVVKELRKAFISVMPSAGYSLKLFNEPGCRKVLSWILLDSEARSSYESIGRYQKLDGWKKGQYRNWDFQFDAPPLPGVELNVRGKFDPKSNCLFVFEIDAVRNLKADIPGDIEIYHPDFEVSVRGKGKGGFSPIAKRPGNHAVHDGSDANANNQRVIIRPSSLDIEFDKAFKTSKVANKQRQARSGRLDKELSGEASTNVSTEESIEGQGLPGADWDNINDITDDAYLYENKFTCFLEMLDLMVDKHSCVINSKQIRKLPEIPGFSKHLLSTDGNPRCLAVIEIKAANITYHVLEVDTSDAGKPLSTQLLKLKPTEKWIKDLEELEKELVRSSLRWPTKLLIKLCGQGNNAGVPHPKSKHGGMLDPNSIVMWAQRFSGWMK